MTAASTSPSAAPEASPPAGLPAADATGRRWNRGLAAAAAAVWFAAVAVTLGPYLLSDRLVTGDFHQHGYWLLRYLDPGLYPGDPVTAYFAGPSAPPLYRWLNAALVPLTGDPQRALEWVGLGLALFCGFLAWRLGVWAGGERRGPVRGVLRTGPGPLPGAGRRGGWPALGGFAAVCLLAYAQTQDPEMAESAALPRTYGLPLTLGVALALAEKRRVTTGLLLLFTAGMYPVMVAGLGLFAFSVEAARLVRDRRLPPRWWALAALAAAAVAVVLLRPSPAWLGELVTGAQARVLPEFQEGGRQEFFVGDWRRFWFGGHRSGLGFSFEPLALAAGATAGLLAAAGRRAVPGVAWAAIGTGLLLFAVAHAVLFKLYLPQRYTTCMIPLFGVLAAGGGVAALGAALVRRLEPEGAQGPTEPSAVDRWGPRLAAPLALLAFWLPLGDGHDRVDRERAYADEPGHVDRLELFATLRSSPPGTVLGGLPGSLDEAPYAARRPVLLSREQALAYHRGFYEGVVTPRFEGALRLSEARSWAEADASADALGVGVWLAQTGEDAGPVRAPEKPFDALRAELAARPGEAVLGSPPADRVLARRGGWALVRVGTGGPAAASGAGATP